MSKPSIVQAEKVKSEPNPLLRGFGCIIMVVLPLVSFGLAYIFTPIIATTGYAPIEILQPINFPSWTYTSPYTSGIATFLFGIQYPWLGLLVFIVALVALSGVSSAIYVTILQVIGPPRYKELDAPPSGRRAKKYTR